MDFLNKIIERDVSGVRASELLVLLDDIWGGGVSELASTFQDVSEGDDLEQAIVALLPECALDVTPKAVSMLLDRWGRDRQFFELLHAALAIAFLKATSLAQSEQESMQHAVVDALIQSDLIWKFDLHLPELLAAAGLPATRDELREWVFAK